MGIYAVVAVKDCQTSEYKFCVKTDPKGVTWEKEVTRETARQAVADGAQFFAVSCRCTSCQNSGSVGFTPGSVPTPVELSELTEEIGVQPHS